MEMIIISVVSGFAGAIAAMGVVTLIIYTLSRKNDFLTITIGSKPLKLHPLTLIDHEPRDGGLWIKYENPNEFTISAGIFRLTIYDDDQKLIHDEEIAHYCTTQAGEIAEGVLQLPINHEQGRPLVLSNYGRYDLFVQYSYAE